MYGGACNCLADDDDEYNPYDRHHGSVHSCNCRTASVTASSHTFSEKLAIEREKILRELLGSCENLCEQAKNLFRHAIRKVLLILFLAHISEGQNCDRLLRGG